METEKALVILRILGPKGNIVYSDVKNYINVTSLMKVQLNPTTSKKIYLKELRLCTKEDYERVN
jgi:hypothetical protein